MTDAKLLMGIMQNDNNAWRHICRKMKPGFISVIGRLFPDGKMSDEDVEDIFQDSCMIMMLKVKEGRVVVSRDGALFSYLLRIGKLSAYNLIRRKGGQTSSEIPDLINEGDLPGEISISEKQQSQDEFLDRVFDSIPDDCRRLLMKFYWDHMPMGEIACMLGLRSADSAKTKKNRCMNKFSEIARRLVDDGEYAEDVVRACVERAALRELMEDERIVMNNENIRIAALDSDDDKK